MAFVLVQNVSGGRRSANERRLQRYIYHARMSLTPSITSTRLRSRTRTHTYSLHYTVMINPTFHRQNPTNCLLSPRTSFSLPAIFSNPMADWFSSFPQ